MKLSIAVWNFALFLVFHFIEFLTYSSHTVLLKCLFLIQRVPGHFKKALRIIKALLSQEIELIFSVGQRLFRHQVQENKFKKLLRSSCSSLLPFQRRPRRLNPCSWPQIGKSSKLKVQNMKSERARVILLVCFCRWGALNFNTLSKFWKGCLAKFNISWNKQCSYKHWFWTHSPGFQFLS